MTERSQFFGDVQFATQHSNQKTKAFTPTASLQSNVFNVLKFGSPGRIRTYNPSVNSRMLYR